MQPYGVNWLVQFKKNGNFRGPGVLTPDFLLEPVREHRSLLTGNLNLRPELIAGKEVHRFVSHLAGFRINFQFAVIWSLLVFMGTIGQMSITFDQMRTFPAIEKCFLDHDIIR